MSVKNNTFTEVEILNKSRDFMEEDSRCLILIWNLHKEIMGGFQLLKSVRWRENYFVYPEQGLVTHLAH
jgi:hypothetical protein